MAAEIDFGLEDKMRLGISACNFGARVRWNRKGWDRLDAIGRERLDYTWTPVCPEVNAGLGVPRQPIRLVSGTGRDFWQGNARLKVRGGGEVTTQVKKGCRLSFDILQHASIHAFVFMEGSPSCGVYRTSLRGRRMGRPPGTFGSLLLDEGFFLIPALDLESPVKWWDWRRRLHAFIWLRRQPLARKKEIYAIWHVYKFMCQEVDDRAAREIGHDLANWPRRPNRERIESWRFAVLDLLRRPSSFRRIHAVMQKHYAHYRKTFGLTTAQLKVPRSTEGKHRFVRELEKLEREARKRGMHFAGAPINYRPGR
jgi:uncharacterized protein YbbK (DUF523 family)